jgi:ComF family protein
MNCLLCNRQIQLQFKFYELFTLTNPAASICGKCEERFQKISERHCPRCMKDGTEEICSDCQNWQSQGYIVKHRAVFTYDTTMKEFFSNYKFIGDYRLRQVFASYFKPAREDKAFTIVPIPVSEKRLRERGFNQVTAFLDAAKINYHKLLEKADTAKQSSLNREERLSSKNTFAMAEGVKIPEKVLLIDDIYTTGATLQHGVEVLRNAGIHEIKSFSLCR